MDRALRRPTKRVARPTKRVARPRYLRKAAVRKAVQSSEVWNRWTSPLEIVALAGARIILSFFGSPNLGLCPQGLMRSRPARCSSSRGSCRPQIHYIPCKTSLNTLSRAKNIVGYTTQYTYIHVMKTKTTLKHHLYIVKSTLNERVKEVEAGLMDTALSSRFASPPSK